MSITQITPPTPANALPVFPVIMATQPSLMNIQLVTTDQSAADVMDLLNPEPWMETEIVPFVLAYDPDDEDELAPDEDLDDDDEEDDFDGDEEDDDFDDDSDDEDDLDDEEDDDYAEEDDDIEGEEG